MTLSSAFRMKNSTAVSRRTFLRGVGAAGLSVTLMRGYVAASDAPVHFTHGVASGDPLSDRVILWTRAVPSDMSSEVTVGFEVATDESFETIVTSGTTKTTKDRDYTIKLDVGGLAPGQSYAYRFVAGETVSMTGRTRTLPAGPVNEVKMAVVSCSNYPQGWFHVYGEIAKSHVDVVLHLGDYIYEYGAGTYSSEAAVAMGRQVQPEHEIISLEDYRMRYGLYRTDPDLQAVHAAHPFITVWDDHEIANDTYDGGAENHNEGEGEFDLRKQRALQVYREWMPVRDPDSETPYDVSYRDFQFGDLAHLIMLDTRLVGRTQALDYQRDLELTKLPFDFSDPENPVALLTAEAVRAANQDAIKRITVPFDVSSGKPTPVTDWEIIQSIDPKNLPEGLNFLPDLKSFLTGKLVDPARTMLGAQQEAWLTETLASDYSRSTTWQVIGQQVLMGSIGMPCLKATDYDFSKKSYVGPEVVGQLQFLAQAGAPFNLDAWDGYPVARERLYSALSAHASNPVVLAGDSHNAWGSNLIARDGEAIGVEFAAPAVSSPGFESYLPIEPTVMRDALQAASPNLKFAQTSRRGWIELTLTPKEAICEWRAVTSVLDKDYDVETSGGATAKAGTKTLQVKDMGLV